MFSAIFGTRTGVVEREAAPGGGKRMSQPRDGEVIGDRRAKECNT